MDTKGPTVTVDDARVKFGLAVRHLATNRGRINERLSDVMNQYIACVDPQSDLPEAVREEFCNALSELAFALAMHEEGGIRTTVNRSSEDAAEAWAMWIVDFHDRISKRIPASVPTAAVRSAPEITSRRPWWKFWTRFAKDHHMSDGNPEDVQTFREMQAEELLLRVEKAIGRPVETMDQVSEWMKQEAAAGRMETPIQPGGEARSRQRRSQLK